MSNSFPKPTAVSPKRHRHQSGRPVKPWVVVLVAGVVLVSASVSIFVLLTSHLNFGIGGTPYALGMLEVGSTHPVSGVFDIQLALSPTPGLTTEFVGLRITNTTSGPVAPGAGPATCTAPAGGPFTAFTPTNCGTPTGNWYAVLVFQNNTIASVFDNSGRWSGATVALNSTMSIYIVTGTQYSRGEDTLNAYGITSTPVTGVASL